MTGYVNYPEDPSCPFCQIVTEDRDGQILWSWPEAVMFEPINPVVPGHRLVVPRAHVSDIGVDSIVTCGLYARVAQVVHRAGEWNVITSIGRAATQTIFHAHVHLVPRKGDDGLKLPWTTDLIDTSSRGGA
jgi:histidine triad (HIT) family protein